MCPKVMRLRALTPNSSVALALGLVFFVSIIATIYILRLTEVAFGAPVSSTAITIDGNLSDWGTPGSLTSGITLLVDSSDTLDSGSDGSSTDINRFWIGMSTAATSGATGATPANPIEYFYFRIDLNQTSSTVTQKYNIQLNLGVAAAGEADHLLFIVANSDDGGDEVDIALFSYDTPYPPIGNDTSGNITGQVTDGPKFGNFPGTINDTDAVGKIGTWDDGGTTKRGIEV